MQQRATPILAAYRNAGLVLLALLAWLVPGLAINVARAALTPAGTIIRNHAIIQFQRDDLSGRIYEAPSNEVLIEVLPVYSLEILPDGDARPAGTPGQTQTAVSTTPNTQVTFNYNLTFTGNIADNALITPVFVHTASTFLPKLADGDTGMLIYKDGNANGVVDSDDIQVASWRDANSNGQIEAGELQVGDLGSLYQPGEIINLLLVFRVPAGVAPDKVAYVGIAGSSIGDPTAEDPVDELTVQNISELIVINDAVMTVTKTADVTQIAPGGSINFTVTGNSVGSAAALRRTLTVDSNSYSGIVIYDIIPVLEQSSVALTLSNPVIDSQPAGINGTLIYSAQTNTNLDLSDLSWNWHTLYVAGDTVIGYISSDGSAGDHDLAVGESVHFSFDASVPGTTLDQALINKAYVSYNTNAMGIQTVKAINDVTVFVRGTTGVLIRDTDFEVPPPPLTPVDDNTSDQQTVALAQAGTFVYFTNRVLNTGSRTDSFNITVKINGVAPLTSNPNGWTFSFFKSDGVTPLRDTGSDGIVDSGAIEPSGSDLNNPLHFIDVVVRVEIPENAGPTAADPETYIVIQATSILNPTVSDTTINQIDDVAAPAMSLSNHIPVGTADPTPYQQTGDPGSGLNFPLIVQNLAPANGEIDTYTLSTPILPAAWSVTYFRDLNQNGILDANELLPVLRTAPVPATGRDYLIARVLIPADTIADADNNNVQDLHQLTFRATSTNQSSIFDEQNDSVVINWQERFELRPNRQGTIEAGGVTIYPHTLSNFGERAHRFFLTLTPGTDDWTYLLLATDTNAYLPKVIDPSDGLEKYYIDLDEAGGANDSSTFLLRLYAPGGVPQGTVDLSTIVATANDPDSPLTPFATTPLHIVADVTYVVAGDLQLLKSANPAPGAAVQPGQEIEYTTTFFNKSATALGKLNIQDQIPAHTSYILQSAVASLPLADGLTGVSFELSRNGGISWSPDSAGAGADPAVTNIRAVFTGALSGGAEGWMTFRVQVQ